MLKIAVLLLLILFLWLYRQPQSIKTDISNKIKKKCGSIKNKSSALFLIVCTVFFTGIFISLIAPKMTNFQDRYWFFILPLCSMLICILLIYLAEKHLSKIKHIGKNAVPVVICVMFVLGAVGHIPENKFLCQQKGELDINNTVKDRVCFLATEKDYFIHQLAPALSKCDSIYQANALDDTLASEIEKIDCSDGALLMINADEMKLEEADDYVQHLNKKIEYIDIIYVGKAEWTDGYYLYNIEA